MHNEAGGNGDADGAGTASELLARRAAERDPGAWSAIFDAHYRPVYTFVRARLAGAAEAEDIASQVFEVAFANAHRFDYRGVPIEGWLIGIARNLVRDYVKRLGRRGYPAELVDGAGPAVSDEADSVGLRADLASAMRSLTEDQQTVITLRFLLDRSVAETARLMDRSEDAVKNLQRRALAALHRVLAGEGYPAGGRP